MAATSALLRLPRELRDLIWHFVFANHEVVPLEMPALEEGGCLACRNKPPCSTLYHDAYIPLLPCKQVYAEASAILRSTISLRIADLRAFKAIRGNPNHPLRCTTRTIIVEVHLDDNNRLEWMTTFQQLAPMFPSLEKLTVHNHMRPPMGYDALIDAIHLAGPLVNLPPSLAYPTNTTVLFAYITEHVMFETAFLGVVKVSDALEVHRNVFLDLLVDDEFAKTSRSWDLQLMTNCLLRIAREHEQPWFDALRRRTRENMNRATAGVT